MDDLESVSSNDIGIVPPRTMVQISDSCYLIITSMKMFVGKYELCTQPSAVNKMKVAGEA